VPEADGFNPGCEGADVRVVRRVALAMAVGQYGQCSVTYSHAKLKTLPKRVGLLSLLYAGPAFPYDSLSPD
jgi:hypothetical protein